MVVEIGQTRLDRRSDDVQHNPSASVALQPASYAYEVDADVIPVTSDGLLSACLPQNGHASFTSGASLRLVHRPQRSYRVRW